MKNITTFIEDNKDTIFRFLTYNKFNIWTPEQVDNKYCDENVYLDTHYEFAKITDAIDTPDGIMLELTLVDPDDPIVNRGHKEYKLLNDIELSRFECDNRDEISDDEEPF